MSRNRQRRAFTMIEILVAMGIIVVLAGMLFMGLRYSSAKAKADTTRTMLQTLRGMMTEREIAVGASKNRQDVDTLFGGVFTTTPNTAATPVAALSSPSTHVDLEKGFDAFRYPNAPSLNQPPYGTNAVGITQGTMAMLLVVPANKAVIANLAQGQYLEKPESGSVWNPPILLDGYGNPVIACPSTGLSGVSNNGGTAYTKKSPDGKPFFVSAGLDGDLSTDDDNIYSFNN